MPNGSFLLWYNTALLKKIGFVVSEGLPFILPPLVLTIVCALLNVWVAAIPIGILTLFFVWFFRFPAPPVPENSSLVLSPADGTVLGIRDIDDSPFSKRIDIFMSVFNVHVNVSPSTGTIARVLYRRGKKLRAGTDQASEINESNYVEMTSEKGSIAFKQIAGILARRIVFYPVAGDELKQGSPVGLIKFGSRVEVFLPPDVTIQVKKGDRVRAGQSVLAFWP